MSDAVRNLVVDWSVFECALTPMGEMRGYVDLDTGRSFVVDTDTLFQVEDAMEESEDDEAFEKALADLCELSPVELVQDARRVATLDLRGEHSRLVGAQMYSLRTNSVNTSDGHAPGAIARPACACAVMQSTVGAGSTCTTTCGRFGRIAA